MHIDCISTISIIILTDTFKVKPVDEGTLRFDMVVRPKVNVPEPLLIISSLLGRTVLTQLPRPQLNGTERTTVSSLPLFPDVDECKRFHPEVCKNGVCVNNIPGYNCYCPSGYVYNSTLLECVGAYGHTHAHTHTHTRTHTRTHTHTHFI